MEMQIFIYVNEGQTQYEEDYKQDTAQYPTIEIKSQKFFHPQLHIKPSKKWNGDCSFKVLCAQGIK